MDKEVFSALARRCPLTEVFGERAKVFSQQDHKAFGYVLSRSVKRLGTVASQHILDFLSLSGQKTCNIRFSQRSEEEEALDLHSVAATTSDRVELDRLLNGIPHVGIVRAKQGKLWVRSRADNLASIRQAVHPDDIRFRHSPALIVKHRWRVTNVPLTVSAQRLSDALASGHGWYQVPVRPQNPQRKGTSWTVMLGSATLPPFESALIEDKLCVISQINPPVSTPALVDTEMLSTSSSSVPSARVLSSTESIQMGMETASKSLSDSIP
eukprot:3100321-Amphidinium_carterae.7